MWIDGLGPLRKINSLHHFDVTPKSKLSHLNHHQSCTNDVSDRTKYSLGNSEVSLNGQFIIV